MNSKIGLFDGVSRPVTRWLAAVIILTGVGLYCLNLLTIPLICIIPMQFYVIVFLGGLVSAIICAVALLAVTTGRRDTGNGIGSPLRKLNRSDLSDSKAKLARRSYYAGMISALVCLIPLGMFFSVFCWPIIFLGMLCGPLGVFLGVLVLLKVTLEQRSRGRDMYVYQPLTVFNMWWLVIAGIIGMAIATPMVGASVEMTGDVGGVGFDPTSSMTAVVMVGVLYIFPAFLMALKKRWAWLLSALIMLAELLLFSLFYANGFFEFEPISSKYSFGFILYLVPIVLVVAELARHRNSVVRIR
ncbi:MAG: hypothetical protein WC562_02545 [Dehalococcoidia bacterium]